MKSILLPIGPRPVLLTGCVTDGFTRIIRDITTATLFTRTIPAIIRIFGDPYYYDYGRQLNALL